MHGNHLALEILNTPKADYGDADPTILKESLLHCSNDGLDKIACTDTVLIPEICTRPLSLMADTLESMNYEVMSGL